MSHPIATIKLDEMPLVTATNFRFGRVDGEAEIDNHGDVIEIRLEGRDPDGRRAWIDIKPGEPMWDDLVRAIQLYYDPVILDALCDYIASRDATRDCERFHRSL